MKFRPISFVLISKFKCPKKRVPFPFFLSIKKSKITCNREQLKASEVLKMQAIKELFKTLKRLPEWKNVWTMKATSVRKWSWKMAGPIAFVGPVWRTTSNKMVYQGYSSILLSSVEQCSPIEEYLQIYQRNILPKSSLNLLFEVIDPLPIFSSKLNNSICWLLAN